MPGVCRSQRDPMTPGASLGGSTDAAVAALNPRLEHPAASAGSERVPLAGVSCCLLPLWGLAPCSGAFGSGIGLNTTAPEGWGLLRSLIPAYFSEV